MRMLSTPEVYLIFAFILVVWAVFVALFVPVIYIRSLAVGFFRALCYEKSWPNRVEAILRRSNWINQTWCGTILLHTILLSAWLVLVAKLPFWLPLYALYLTWQWFRQDDEEAIVS
ncbi:MAG: hypothetical protein WC518_02505 [Patescibacteria group bacterium]